MEENKKPIKPSEKKNLLYGRIEKTKPLLPKDWRKRLVERQPEYDSLAMADFVRNVHSLRVAHEPLTVILEEIAKEHQAELKKVERRVAKATRKLQKP